MNFVGDDGLSENRWLGLASVLLEVLVPTETVSFVDACARTRTRETRRFVVLRFRSRLAGFAHSSTVNLIESHCLFTVLLALHAPKCTCFTKTAIAKLRVWLADQSPPFVWEVAAEVRE